MKITAIIGSNNENSFTKNIVDHIFQQLHSLGNYQTEVVHLQEQKLHYCIGCNTCFDTGACVLDSGDSMKEIKEKLFRSDCIVFASPVYADGCPGIMKTFIDRLSSKLHLIQYAGKLGFTLVTTSQSGHEKVGNYLKQLQIHLGIKHMGMYPFVRAADDFSVFIGKATRDMHTKMQNNYGFSFVGIDKYFHAYRKIHSLDIPEHARTFEWHYWNQEEIKNCKTFQEYALLMRSKMQ